ncbi:MAG: Na/Pi cotransporter family protein [Candidatus Aminicenantes bacterium]|nr:Na/Pi cotransporter family protein [Candidatus Aminicenantes bacterium]
MDWKHIVFQSIGGLGLFLMGMKIMSEGMQKAAGSGLRKTLNFLTTNRILAIIIGFFVTAVIQSSSATTVMAVGFVNATLMTLRQAIGVILGANIGTTVTGWIVTLKIIKFSMPMIGLGVFIKFFSKSEKWKYTGEVIFGFGILFLGMQTMKMGFAPLRESPEFIAFFMRVDGLSFWSILLGLGIGAITTFIVQSSSATIGITIALASQGLLNFEGAVSLILGENIGTTITANLASIGGNYQAKRTAIAHTLFNVFGVFIVLSFFYPFVRIVESLVPGLADMTVKTADQAALYGAAINTKPLIGKHIAMAHTLFNVSNVVVFAFLVPLLARVCEKIIPEPKKKKKPRAVEFSHIDFNLIDTPALGIAQTEKELMVMADRVSGSSDLVKEIINDGENRRELCDKVFRKEKIIDEYQKYITEFLVTLSSSALSESDANHIGNYMTLSHNLEKFADHLEHITLIYDKIDRQNIRLPGEATEIIDKIFTENENFFKKSLRPFSEKIDAQDFMDRSQVLNRRVKKIIKEAKIAHLSGTGKKMFKNSEAIHYMDILNYLDGMRAQAYNIAEVTSGTKYNI